jgi:phosphoribosylformylglycinamidine cyclo-ligase
MSVWKGIAQDAVVMNLDDLLCTGCYDNILLSTTIGRNRMKIPGEVVAAIIHGVEDFLSRLRTMGIGIWSTGGETADVGDLVRTIIVDSTVTARMKRKEVITNDNITAGDVIIGLASSGKALYEENYNSGIGSNGLTSARHDMLSGDYGVAYPESYDGSIANELVYSGTLHLRSATTVPGMDTGKLMLSPTRTYAPAVRDIIKKLRHHIHGMVHCTGGAQTKVLNFINNLHIVKDNLFTPPPVFLMIQEQSGTAWKEMYQVFNMGHRMEIYTSEKMIEEIIGISGEYGIEARIIGHCEASDTKKLTIKTGYGVFEY